MSNDISKLIEFYQAGLETAITLMPNLFRLICNRLEGLPLRQDIDEDDLVAEIFSGKPGVVMLNKIKAGGIALNTESERMQAMQIENAHIVDRVFVRNVAEFFLCLCEDYPSGRAFLEEVKRAVETALGEIAQQERRDMFIDIYRQIEQLTGHVPREDIIHASQTYASIFNLAGQVMEVNRFGVQPSMEKILDAVNAVRGEGREDEFRDIVQLLRPAVTRISRQQQADLFRLEKLGI